MEAKEIFKLLDRNIYNKIPDKIKDLVESYNGKYEFVYDFLSVTSFIVPNLSLSIFANLVATCFDVIPDKTNPIFVSFRHFSTVSCKCFNIANANSYPFGLN